MTNTNTITGFRPTQGPAHGFADVNADRAGICLCGAAFVDGYHLDAIKRAHLAAVTA